MDADEVYAHTLLALQEYTKTATAPTRPAPAAKRTAKKTTAKRPTAAKKAAPARKAAAKRPATARKSAATKKAASAAESAPPQPDERVIIDEIVEVTTEQPTNPTEQPPASEGTN